MNRTWPWGKSMANLTRGVAMAVITLSAGADNECDFLNMRRRMAWRGWRVNSVSARRIPCGISHGISRKQKPPDAMPGVFGMGWVTKWGFGVSGEFSCLLGYPGEP